MILGLLRGTIGLARAAAGLALGAKALDWAIAARRGDRALPAIHSRVEIDAPIERVWDVIADVERQVDWMADMIDLRLDGPGPIGVGTRGTATVRILGISVSDPVTITVFDAPTRYAVRHEGVFTGSGEITLEPGGRPDTTLVRWRERLVPPLFPDLGAVVQAPILGVVFQADLERLKRLVETGSPDGPEPPLVRLLTP